MMTNNKIPLTLPSTPPVALFVFSNDLMRYLPNIEKERKYIREALEHYNDKNYLRVIIETNAVDATELFRLFNRYSGRIFLFHFAGHADGKGLQFNDENLSNETGLATGLASLFKREVEEGILQFVFLNGCSTQAQIDQLTQAGVAAIIATRFAIEDTKALQFSKQFYRAWSNADQANPFGVPTNIKSAFQTAASFLQTTEPHTEILETTRGLVIKRGQFPWILDTRNPDLLLPNTGNDARIQEYIKNLREELIDENEWVDSFEDDLLNIGVKFSRNKLDVFGHFGWLIQDYLRKILTFEDEADTEEEIDEAAAKLVKISYMTEAFHSSLRYLCYIQLAQLFHSKGAQNNPSIRAFFHLPFQSIDQFDYLNLLVHLSTLIEQDKAFVKEINDLILKLSDEEDKLYDTVLYLGTFRNKLIKGEIPSEEANTVYQEYLTALIFWLRQLVFLAKYRLVSIKNIDLNYRFGSPTFFEHLYGELHGFYKESFSPIDEEASAYETLRLQEKYTYNRSVLLLKGDYLQGALRDINSPNDYLSLSPMVIDYSVFAKADGGQTPEIYYYQGRRKREFYYSKYNNELTFPSYDPRLQHEKIATQNTEKPKLNQLHKHIVAIFKPFKPPRP